jgi:hypothetical protein
MEEIGKLSRRDKKSQKQRKKSRDSKSPSKGEK